MKKVVFGICVFIPLGIVIIIAIVFYDLYNNLDIKPRLKTLGLVGITKGLLKVTLNINVSNKSTTTIKARKVSFKIIYNDHILAVSEEIKLVEIKSKEENSIDLPLNIILNKETGEVANLFLNKKPIPLVINVRARIYFIPLSTNINYIYEP